MRIIELESRTPECLGFHVYRRTETDGQGGPYPLLYMRL